MLIQHCYYVIGHKSTFECGQTFLSVTTPHDNKLVKLVSSSQTKVNTTLHSSGDSGELQTDVPEKSNPTTKPVYS